MDASQNRREFKFILPPGLGEIVRQRIGREMAPDRGAADGYPVLSEYFDTAERTSYWHKQFGIPNRRRVRSRVYGRRDGAIPASAFIEVKHKLDGVTVKRRVPVELAELVELANGILPARRDNSTPAEDRILGEIAELVTQGGSRPVVQIRYHRFAYDSGPEGNIRITFDQDPRCRFRRIPMTPDDPDFELPLLEPGSSIMEVKTVGPVPFWFRKLVGEFRLHPSSFSKYMTALDLYEFKSRSAAAAPKDSNTPDSARRKETPRARKEEEKPQLPVAAKTLRRPPSPSARDRGGFVHSLLQVLYSLFHPQRNG